MHGGAFVMKAPATWSRLTDDGGLRRVGAWPPLPRPKSAPFATEVQPALAQQRPVTDHCHNHGALRDPDCKKAKERHMTPKIVPLVMMTALLAGCGGGSGGRSTSGQAPTVARQADPAPCGAAAYAGLRGQQLTALPGDEIPGTMRIILPGDTLTSDFNPTRLNVTLDDANRIATLSCG